MEKDGMFRKLGTAALLALAVAMPAHEALAQDTLGGALFGGAAGAIVGGALGGGRGAAIGAVIGAGTGAAIAAEGERRRGGYYYYRRGCYMPRPDGAYVRVDPRYCY
jgi:Glycine zipper